MLPKIQSPTFGVTQPSTQKQILLRPFLVKEEKILLMAKESGEKEDIYNAICQIVQNCVIADDFDVNNIPIYDLEWLFIRLRAISVNNIVKFTVEDSDDGIEYNLECNLDDVEVLFPKEHSGKVMLDEEVGLLLTHPTPTIAEKLKQAETMTDVIYETIKACIVTVFDSEETYEWKDYSDADKDAWLESLGVEAYNSLAMYFQTTPRIEHVVEYENSTGKKKKVVFRTLNDFFSLG